MPGRLYSLTSNKSAAFSCPLLVIVCICLEVVIIVLMLKEAA